MSGASAGIGLISGYDFNAPVRPNLRSETAPCQLQGRSAEVSREMVPLFSDIGLQLESIRSAASGLTSSLLNPNRLLLQSESAVGHRHSAASTGSWDLLVSRLSPTSQVLSEVWRRRTRQRWLDSIVFELGEGRLRDDVELSQLNGGFGIERGSTWSPTALGPSRWWTSAKLPPLVRSLMPSTLRASALRPVCKAAV